MATLGGQHKDRPSALALIMSLAAMGVYGITGQIILIRELLVIFYGNELSLGLIFACWLFWVSVGAAAASDTVRRLRNPVRVLAICLFLAFISLPVETALVRFLRGILGTSPGLLIPLNQIAVATALVLAPLSFLIGFTFPLGAGVYAPRPTGAARKIGTLYIAETAGSAIGALCFTLLLAGRMSHFSAEALLGIPLVISIPFLLVDLPSAKARLADSLWAVLPAVVTVLLLAGGTTWLEITTAELRWRFGHPGFDLVESEDSRYEHLAVGRLANQTTLYGNGTPILSMPDEYEAGISAHLLLVEHPAPRRVLLFGGGTPDMLREILKHPVQRLDYVEMDPALIRIARKYTPRSAMDVLDDPRVHIHAQDGRAFLHRAKETYDQIIVRLPDPSTAMLNRFYTVEFFQQVAKRLASGGVFVFDVGGAVNYIGEDIGAYRATLFRSLQSVFPHILITPGERNFFIASNSPDIISQDAEELSERYLSRRIESKHFSHALYPILLPRGRMDWLRAALEEIPVSNLNTDGRPVSYFHNILLWDRFSGSQIGPALKAVAHLRPWMWAAALLIMLITRIAWIRVRSQHSVSQPVFNALSTIATTGFLAMGIQLVILFSFQNQLGYIYEKIGLVVAAFMLGLFLGGRLGSVRAAHGTSPSRDLTVIEIAILALCLTLPRLLALPEAAGSPAGLLAEAWFFLLSGASGFLAGLQFPLVSHLYLQQRAETHRAAGQVDWADHLGACLGALLAGSLLVPLLGVTNTCLLMAGVKAANLILLAYGQR